MLPFGFTTHHKNVEKHGQSPCPRRHPKQQNAATHMADTNLESPNHEMSVNLHVDPNISTPIVAILMDAHLRSMIIDMPYYYIR